MASPGPVKAATIFTVAVFVCVFALLRGPLSSTSYYALGRRIKRHCLLLRNDYTASPLEIEWLQNISQWVLGDYCVHAHRFDEQAFKWVDDVLAHAASSTIEEMDPDIFSSFTHTYDCGGNIENHTSWIEPLAFGLRHPSAFCAGADADDPDYMLIAARSYINHKPNRHCFGRPCQSIMIDVGRNRLTALTTNVAEPGSQWLLNAYLEHGIHFNRYFAWNSTNTFSQVMKTQHFLAMNYTHFDLESAVNLDARSLWHPARIARAIAQPGDFVVVNLNVNDSRIAKGLLREIVGIVPDLIDELFYTGGARFPAGTSHPGNSKNQNLTELYRLFYDMRKGGLRAHAWA